MFATNYFCELVCSIALFLKVFFTCGALNFERLHHLSRVSSELTMNLDAACVVALVTFPLSVIPRILTKKSHKTAHITKKKRDDKKIEVTLLLHSPILNHFQSCLSHSAFKSCRLLA